MWYFHNRTIIPIPQMARAAEGTAISGDFIRVNAGVRHGLVGRCQMLYAVHKTYSSRMYILVNLCIHRYLCI